MKLQAHQLKSLYKQYNLTEAQVAINCKMTRNYLNSISQGKTPATREKLVNILTRGIGMPKEIADEYIFTWELENLCKEYHKPSIAYVSPLQLNDALNRNYSNKKPLEERDFAEQIMYKLDVAPSYARKMVEALRDLLALRAHSASCPSPWPTDGWKQ